jgi:hypothetical protein
MKHTSLTNTSTGLKEKANSPQKQAGVTIPISNKATFKRKLVKRDKEGHNILIKGTNHEEEVKL